MRFLLIILDFIINILPSNFSRNSFFRNVNLITRTLWCSIGVEFLPILRNGAEAAATGFWLSAIQAFRHFLRLSQVHFQAFNLIFQHQNGSWSIFIDNGLIPDEFGSLREFQRWKSLSITQRWRRNIRNNQSFGVATEGISQQES